MHYFVAPCCLCAFQLNEMYTECRIAVVQVPFGSPGAFLNGEYVAECALRKCGYFGEIYSLAHCDKALSMSHVL
jgi:hypothetical protein